MRYLSLVLVAALVLGSSTLFAQAPAAKSKVSVAYIPGEAAVAVVLRPRRIATSPEFALMPVEVLSAATRKEYGIDATEIEEVVAFLTPQGTNEPLMGAVIRLGAAVKPQDLIPRLRGAMTEAQHNGKKYLRAPVAPFVSLAIIDEKTLLVATEASIKEMFDAKPGDTPIHKLIGDLDPGIDMAALVSVEALRPIVGVVLLAMPAPPPAYRQFFKAPHLLSAIEIKSTQGPSGRLELVLRAVDEDAAGELEQLVLKGISVAREQILASLPPAKPDDVMAVASEKYVRRMLDKAGEWLRPKRTGDKLVLAVENSQLQGSAATTGVMAALLLPAVQKVREAALRTSASNQLKQILLAHHMYLDTHKAFSAQASFDKAGKPLLSWRVHLLPYLEQEALYRKFRLDEPWDSEHNKQLIPLIPQVYQSTARKDSRTNFLAVVGPGAMFDGQAGAKMAEIKDGLSNTIALVEVDDDRAVVWTKPEDFEFDREKPRAGLGRARAEGILAAFGDGSVRLIPGNIAPATLLGLFTRSGGEVIPPF